MLRRSFCCGLIGLCLCCLYVLCCPYVSPRPRPRHRHPVLTDDAIRELVRPGIDPEHETLPRLYDFFPGQSVETMERVCGFPDVVRRHHQSMCVSIFNYLNPNKAEQAASWLIEQPPYATLSKAKREEIWKASKVGLDRFVW